MQNYKVTYSTGENEHALELNAEDKEQAGMLARERLGTEVKVLDVIHIPESYELF